MILSTKEATPELSVRDILLLYLKMKVEQEDWHAVSDAANDLREHDARNERVEVTIRNSQELEPIVLGDV